MRFKRANARRESLYARGLSYLPNESGFEFIGIREDGSELECEVRKAAANGNYYATDKNGKIVNSQLRAWRRKP
jgi:hypothetical protein